MTFASIYAILVGIGMIGQWGFFLITGQVPELESEPIRIRFHLVAEFLTALALIVGGLALLMEQAWGSQIYLVALGMLFYTIIVSPGYFAQKGEWPLVGMFGALVILSIISLILVL